MANFLIKKQEASKYGTSASGTGSMNLLIKPNSKNLSTKKLISKLKISHDNIFSEVLLVQDGMDSTWAYYLYIGNKDLPEDPEALYTAPNIIFPSNMQYEKGNCKLDRYYDICSYRCKIVDGKIDFSKKEVLDLTYSVSGDVGEYGSTKPLQVFDLEDVRDNPQYNWGQYVLNVTTQDMASTDLAARVGNIIITQAESDKQLKFSVTQNGYSDKTEITFNYTSKGDTEP